MVSPGDIERLIYEGGWAVIDTAASLFGGDPPSRIMEDIRRSNPDAAVPYVDSWNDGKSTLESRVSAIQSDVTLLARDWTGEAADAAVGYVDLIRTELAKLAQTMGSLATTLESALIVVRATKRNEEDAAVTTVNVIVGAAVATIASIGVALLFPVAIPGIIAAFVAFLLAYVGAFVNYILTLYRQHQRQAEDLGRRLDQLEQLTVADEITPPGAMSAPSPSPVTIKTSIAPPPPVPALG